MKRTYKIESDSDFEILLRDFVKTYEGNKNASFPIITFKDYPKLAFNVKGENYQSSVNTYLINALSDLINSIQRTYCMVKYDTINLQKLSSEDKSVSDIIFTITEGSSEGESENSALANTIFNFLTVAMNGLNSWQRMTVLISVIVTLGGLSALYLTNQAEETKTIANISNKAIDAQQATTKDLISIIKEKGQSKISQEIDNQSKQGRESFMKSIAQDSKVESATLGEVRANREQLDEYKKRNVIERQKNTKSDDFIIKGVEFYAPTYRESEVTISVIRQRDQAEFSLKTSQDILNEDEITQLKMAIGTDTILHLSYIEIIENKKLAKGQFIEIKPTKK